eukprot:TRINITY_DN8024_c0_g1_i1.p1 TRINITY_DN8024_c0_g1~~TRINITY_DN8024_c0_g1_i1.p1  ORF type:complete len:482 (+),score=75.40 TRINITY_DN8024_c0_g1_i1:71-1447(+)
MAAVWSPSCIGFAWILLLPSAAGTSSKMDFLPLGHVRTDPIISNTCLADHVHTFYGANVPLRPELTYDDLRAATETTGTVVENKGLYWHPSIYQYEPDTGIYTLKDTWFGTGYYIWFTKQATAYPNGFSMIAQGAASRSNFTCLNPSPCKRKNCWVPSSSWRFPQTACDELEIQLGFPTCWDGKNVTSPDGTSHVAYAIKDEPADSPELEFAFPCPASHPVKIPEIRFYFRIKNYEGGAHGFSNGGDMPHADYMSGFSSTVLQNALDNCNNPSEAASPDAFCDTFFTFQDAPKKQKEDPAIFATLQKYKPSVIFPTNTITTEQISNIHTLPRGVCTGSLIPTTTTTTTTTTRACRQLAPGDDCYGLSSTECNLYYDSFGGGRACVVLGGYCDGDETGLSFNRCATSLLGSGHLRKARQAKARVLLQHAFEVPKSDLVDGVEQDLRELEDLSDTSEEEL